jgi:hypothetical protein
VDLFFPTLGATTILDAQYLKCSLASVYVVCLNLFSLLEP